MAARRWLRRVGGRRTGEPGGVVGSPDPDRVGPDSGAGGAGGAGGVDARAVDGDGVWGRLALTGAAVARRTAELGTPPAEAGALLSRAARAGRVVDAEGARLARLGATRWPAGLRVPADAGGRAVHDRLRTLVGARRDVLHRATLLTLPADAGEQSALLRGLARAVDRLESLADAVPGRTGTTSDQASGQPPHLPPDLPGPDRPTGGRWGQPPGDG